MSYVFDSIDMAVDLFLQPVEDDEVVAVTLQELVLEDDTRVCYTLAQVAEQRLQEVRSRLTRALKESSDLVPNVYEGEVRMCKVTSSQTIPYLSINYFLNDISRR